LIHEYECPGEDETIQIERSINAPEENYRCSTCGATLRRIYISPAITFRGSGFYTNDK
jgi:predicted nucleic acid-binding Zn ribbon protein